jgi:hypothetical protein
MANTDYNRIMIKYSDSTPEPPLGTLFIGELAYSNDSGDSAGGERLFIGINDGDGQYGYPNQDDQNAWGAAANTPIAGAYFMRMLDHPRGKLHPNSAIITDSNGEVNYINVQNLYVDGGITNNNGDLVLGASTNIIDADSNRIINVANPQNGGDAVNKSYIDNLNVFDVGADVVISGDGQVYTGEALQIIGGSNINTTRQDLPAGVRATVHLDSALTGLSSVTIGNIRISGNEIETLAGGVLRIDPNPDGPAGRVIIDGDFEVTGTTTTVNSTTVEIDDKNLTLAKGSGTDSSNLDGAGVTFGDSVNDAPSIVYRPGPRQFSFNRDIKVHGWGRFDRLRSDYDVNVGSDVNADGDVNATDGNFSGDVDVTGNVTGGGDATFDNNVTAGTITGKYTGFDSDFNSKTTDGLTEGNTNLYYTQARFDSAFLQKTTDSLGEGNTNLWYTSARADSDARHALTVIDAGGDGSVAYVPDTGVLTYTGPSASEVRSHFSAGGDLSYDSSTGRFEIDVEVVYTSDNFDSDLQATNTDFLPEGDSNLYYTTNRFDSDFATKTSDDLTEGSNLFFTNERVDDRVASLLQAGEGIDLTYTDGTNQLSVSAELATTLNAGIATFDSQDFLVTSGNVEINVIDCGTF